MTRARTGSVLDYEISGPSDPRSDSTVAVLLHGRGSDRHDLQQLRGSIPAEWVLITPQAPFPGAPWGYGSGGAWYRYREEDHVFTETLDQSLAKLDAFYRELPDLLGFEPTRVVVGGFSQGGTMSMAYALTRPGSVVAAINFSGFLPASVHVDETGATPPPTPIFWGHGIGDPAIPISLAEKGRNRLRRAGANLVTRDYRIGHWIVAEEVQEAVATVEALSEDSGPRTPRA